MSKKIYNYSVHFTSDQGANTLTTLAENKKDAANKIAEMFKGLNFQLIRVRKLVVTLRAKNYLIIRTTGTAAYSTEIQAYKMVNNKAVHIGSLYGESQDVAIRYLKDIFTQKSSKINIVELYRGNKVSIQEIIM